MKYTCLLNFKHYCQVLARRKLKLVRIVSLKTNLNGFHYTHGGNFEQNIYKTNCFICDVLIPQFKPVFIVIFVDGTRIAFGASCQSPISFLISVRNDLGFLWLGAENIKLSSVQYIITQYIFLTITTDSSSSQRHLHIYLHTLFHSDFDGLVFRFHQSKKNGGAQPFLP